MLSVAVVTFGKRWQMISREVFCNRLSEDALCKRYKRLCKHTNTNPCKTPINKPSQGGQMSTRKFWTSEEDEILLGLKSIRNFDEFKVKLPGRSWRAAQKRIRRITKNAMNK